MWAWACVCVCVCTQTHTWTSCGLWFIRDIFWGVRLNLKQPDFFFFFNILLVKIVSLLIQEASSGLMVCVVAPAQKLRRFIYLLRRDERTVSLNTLKKKKDSVKWFKSLEIQPGWNHLRGWGRGPVKKKKKTVRETDFASSWGACGTRHRICSEDFGSTSWIRHVRFSVWDWETSEQLSKEQT